MTQSNLTFTESQPIPEGYKKTEVGLIPQDWSVQKFGELFEPSITRIKLKSDDSVAFVGMQDVSESAQLITQKVVKFHEVRSGFTFFGKGDVLVAKITPCFENGKGCITDNLITNIGYGSTEFHVLRANENSVSKFIYYWTVNSTFRKKLELDMVGSAGHRRVPLSSIQNYLIPLPATHAEQQKIATALSDTDNLISELEKFIEKKQAIKTATMQQLLTGKTQLPEFSLRKDGTPKAYKDSELGRIPEDWDVKKIREFTDCTAGGTPSTCIKSYWGGQHPWMSSGELHLKRVFDVKERITDAGLKYSSTKYIPSDSVLMGLAGQGKTRGTVAISKIKLCTNQSIASIFPSEEHNTEYLYYNLDSRYEELRGLSTGDGGRGGLNLSIIRKLVIPFPTLNEQNMIALVLSDLDRELEQISIKLAKLNKIKQGMMQELLTGKTRLV